jgi:hypothetical protein
MTVETSHETRPISESTVTRVRVVRIKLPDRPEFSVAFSETVKVGSPREDITEKYIIRMIGGRFRGRLRIVAYAESPELSNLATSIYQTLLAKSDRTRALRAIERFVTLSESLTVTKSVPL